MFADDVGNSAVQLNRIVLLYPFGDITERKNGASQRAGLLLDYLSQVSCKVVVVQIGERSDYQDGNIKFLYYQPTGLSHYFNRLVEILYHLLVAIKTSGETWNYHPGDINSTNQHLVWWHYQYRYDRNFNQLVTRVVRQSDFVFLKYTFWAANVIHIAHRCKKPVFLADYDVLADQVNLPHLKKLLLENELRAHRQADLPVCVSPEDQQRFAKYNVAVKVISTPVDTQIHIAEYNKIHVKSDLQRRFDLKLKDCKICMFIGSRYFPNLQAVEYIKNIASRMSADYQFLVIGSVAKREIDGNFHALGIIDDELLQQIYSLSDLVLMPLPWGTGMSVKTIEAMSYSKVIIGSQIAFRGLPAVNGDNCIVMDDPQKYPQIISSICDDQAQHDRISKRARKLAEKYDYRIVFEYYLEHIKQNYSANSYQNSS